MFCFFVNYEDAIMIYGISVQKPKQLTLTAMAGLARIQLLTVNLTASRGAGVQALSHAMHVFGRLFSP